MTDDKPPAPSLKADYNPAVPTLKQLEHRWTDFGFIFNNHAITNGFRRFFKAQMIEGMLTLGVHDLDKGHTEKKPQLLVLVIADSEDKAKYELTRNLDPYVNQTDFEVHKFDKTAAGIEQMNNRCLAEVLNIVGMVQGTSYMASRDQGQGGPTFTTTPMLQ